MHVTTQYAPASLLPVGAQAPRALPSRRNVAVLYHAEYRWLLQPPYVLRPPWVKRPGDLDLLTLKVVSESRVMWATSVPILFFLGRFTHRRVGASSVDVGTCWPWETVATLPSARPREALRRTRGRRGAGHIVADARLQLVPHCGWVSTGLHVFISTRHGQLFILWLDVGPGKIWSQDCSRVITEFALYWSAL